MSTLMTRETFDKLAKIRSALNATLAPGPAGRLAGICVPWAGRQLKKEGGIYYVGMATDGDYWADDPQTYEQRLRRAGDLCSNRHDRARSPFWQFLDGLTWALLGAPFNESADRWGWSNLLKIGWSVGNPNQWRSPVEAPLIEAQRNTCVVSLHEEFETLRNSLVVIASFRTFGVLESPDFFPKLIPQWQENYDSNWNKDRDEQTGVWSFTDPNSKNLYVHCYHPGYAVRTWDSFWGSALGRVIYLAREMPSFASNSTP